MSRAARASPCPFAARARACVRAPCSASGARAQKQQRRNQRRGVRVKKCPAAKVFVNVGKAVVCCPAYHKNNAARSENAAF